MTYLQIINAVLRRLREDEVATYNQSEYSTLIGDFVNEIKREVEDSWNWTALRTDLTVSATSGTSNYTLPGSTNNTRILRAYNSTDEFYMQRVPYDWIKTQLDLTSTQSSAPSYYNINGQTSGELNLDVWPIPDGSYTLTFNSVVPQDDLAAGATVLTVPSWPVVLGAYARAISERGEDGGQQFGEAMMQYQKALSDAISLDSLHTPHELIWEAV